MKRIISLIKSLPGQPFCWEPPSKRSTPKYIVGQQPPSKRSTPVETVVDAYCQDDASRFSTVTNFLSRFGKQEFFHLQFLFFTSHNVNLDADEFVILISGYFTIV